MIPGVVASQGIAASGGGSVPEGALVHLDFINGLYFVEGTDPPAVGDVLDHPEWIGAGGLELRFANETTIGTGIAHVLGDALTTLLTANWTAVIEFETLADDGSEHVFSVQSAAPLWEDAMWARADNSSFIGVFETNGGITSREINAAGLVSAGVHRIAITRTDAKLAVSVNGATATVDSTSSPSFVPETATFGSYHGDWLSNEVNIRSLTVYAPRADADLPSLSA
jgi:hypothetical protein